MYMCYVLYIYINNKRTAVGSKYVYVLVDDNRKSILISSTGTDDVT